MKTSQTKLLEQIIRDSLIEQPGGGTEYELGNRTTSVRLVNQNDERGLGKTLDPTDEAQLLGYLQKMGLGANEYKSSLKWKFVTISRDPKGSGSVTRSTVIIDAIWKASARFKTPEGNLANDYVIILGDPRKRESIKEQTVSPKKVLFKLEDGTEFQVVMKNGSTWERGDKVFDTENNAVGGPESIIKSGTYYKLSQEGNPDRYEEFAVNADGRTTSIDKVQEIDSVEVSKKKEKEGRLGKAPKKPKDPKPAEDPKARKNRWYHNVIAIPKKLINADFDKWVSQNNFKSYHGALRGETTGGGGQSIVLAPSDLENMSGIKDWVPSQTVVEPSVVWKDWNGQDVRLYTSNGEIWTQAEEYGVAGINGGLMSNTAPAGSAQIKRMQQLLTYEISKYAKEWARIKTLDPFWAKVAGEFKQDGIWNVGTRFAVWFISTTEYNVADPNVDAEFGDRETDQDGTSISITQLNAIEREILNKNKTTQTNEQAGYVRRKKMAKTLAEGLLRYRVKNLNETQKQKLKIIIADQKIRHKDDNNNNSNNNNSSSTYTPPTEEQIKLATEYRKWANSTPELTKKYGKESTYDLDATSPSPYNTAFKNSYKAGKTEFDKRNEKSDTDNSITLNDLNNSIGGGAEFKADSKYITRDEYGKVSHGYYHVTRPVKVNRQTWQWTEGIWVDLDDQEISIYANTTGYGEIKDPEGWLFNGNFTYNWTINDYYPAGNLQFAWCPPRRTTNTFKTVSDKYRIKVYSAYKGSSKYNSASSYFDNYENQNGTKINFPWNGSGTTLLSAIENMLKNHGSQDFWNAHDWKWDAQD